MQEHPDDPAVGKMISHSPCGGGLGASQVAPNLSANYPRLPAAAFPSGTAGSSIRHGSAVVANSPLGSLYRTTPAASSPGLGSAGLCSTATPLGAGISRPSLSLGSRPSTGGMSQADATMPASGEGVSKQRLQELGETFRSLEGFDEAASVGQAHIGSQMQSQLRSLLDIHGDTPRHPGASPGAGFAQLSPKLGSGLGSWGLTPTSPKARAASTRPGDLPQPGPSYDGPRLEPPAEAIITADWAMQLVYHFQQNPRVPLPARYLCRLIDDAEHTLEARLSEGPVHQLKLHGSGQADQQLVVVGDTHGQLVDVLWIFYKLGVPSPTKRYLFNGDICDRGDMATEIWALLLAFMAVWPESVTIQRGNHEDRLLNMDLHCGGFYDEVLSKYGRTDGLGALVYEKFTRLFGKLPLATAVDGQVFVVHGGLSRGPPAAFLRLLGSNRVRGAEIPMSSACSSAADLAYVDAMWADPQDGPGVAPNPRGAGLVLFGPDVTARFLAATGFGLVVRSHQVPPNNDGFFVHHGGKLLTVFSASNYCGLAGNQGAVLVLRPDGSCEAVRHWAPPFEHLAEVLIEAPEDPEATPAAVRQARRLRRQSTAGALETRAQQAEATGKDSASRAERLEREVLQGAARLIVEKKQALFSYWEECDAQVPRGFITKQDWEEGMRAVLGDGLPWKAIGKILKVKDTLTKDVDYRRFLGRFRVTVMDGPAGGDRWAEELLGRFYGRLLALKGDAGSLEELEGFLGGGDGKVSTADALEAFRWVLGNYISEEQAVSLLRTLAAHAAPDPSPVGRSICVFEFLSRLDVCYQHQAAVEKSAAKAAPGLRPRREATPWARSVLAHVGRLLWMEDAEGSPKAGSQRMLEVFRCFDQDGDGLLQCEEFGQAVKTLLQEYAAELPAELAEETASDERIRELVECIDYSGDGMVNYMEFLHAFQPVDRTPGRGLQMDLMEQICTTIWANKASLLRTLQVLEENGQAAPATAEGGGDALLGRVSRENLKRTLRSLNASLEAARGCGHGAPLTGDQIDILVDHAAFDAGGTLDYQAFLDSFEVVDTGADVEGQGTPPPLGQRHPGGAGAAARLMPPARVAVGPAVAAATPCAGRGTLVVPGRPVAAAASPRLHFGSLSSPSQVAPIQRLTLPSIAPR